MNQKNQRIRKNYLNRKQSYYKIYSLIIKFVIKLNLVLKNVCKYLETNDFQNYIKQWFNNSLSNGYEILVIVWKI